MANSRQYKIGIDVEADENASGPIGKVAGAADSLDAAFKDTNKSAGGLGANLLGLVNPAGLAVGAVTAIGGAMVGAGMKAMDLSDQVKSATAGMTTDLGLSKDEAAELQEVMRSIYANNYGEGFEDIAESLVTVEKQFQRINGQGIETQGALQGVTEKAIAFSDAFGEDLGETVNAQVTLMEQFGYSATEAMDFLVTANQRGLNSSGDLLDTIGEYAVQFGGGKATAAEFYAILEQGNAGGVLGTDKAADAFKEFGIRILDDSKTTQTALADIGISYDALKQGFADGSITTMNAMQLVIDKLNAIEDPIERNKAGVALFGTQWEDMGEAGILALGNITDAMGSMEGASASLEEQYKTNGAELEAATRQWENALVDVGDELNLLAVEALPLLSKAMTDWVIPAIGHFTEWLADMREGNGYLQEYQRNYGGYDMTLRDNPNPRPVTPEPDVPAEKSSLITGEAQSSMVNSNNETHVQVFVERGDPVLVEEAAHLGVRRAQQSRGE